MNGSGRALGLVFGLGMLFCATDARAFCRTRGCDTTDPKQQCEYDANGCLDSGPVLHWPSGCVSFDVQKDGSALRGITYEAARGAITAGFQQWLNADCGGGAKPAVEVSDFGAVECRQAEYNQDAGNANVFMFRDDKWPYDNAEDTLALTTLIFNANDGEIYDADVEINTFDANLSIGNAGRGGVDFASVITHEIGHFLGLSHSSVNGATMEVSYSPGATDMASIELDDEAGICTALAPGRPVKTDSCEPRHGFASECAIAESGCQVTPGRSGALGSALVALLGLGLTLTRRRLRREAPPA